MLGRRWFFFVVFAVQSMAVFGTTAAERPELPAAWQQQWNAEIGLWTRYGAGHTAPVAGAAQVHPGTTAAAQLVAAAVVGRLEEVEAGAVLKALRQMQVTDGSSRHGCLRWYWEEPRPVDTNAAFFTGLNLIVLQRGFPDQLERLDANARDTLAAILRDLSVWFDQTLARPSRYYPNKYMGDLVCRWLLIEALDQQADRQRVADEMLASAHYWREEHWGWGEHMSNIYAAVLLDQLSVLLMLSQELPAEVRHVYTGLRDDLLAIEDTYGGGPRVPMIRDYNFTNSPAYENYRDRVRRVRTVQDLITGNLAMRPVLAELGWSSTVPPRAPAQQDIQVPCYGEVTAVARVQGKVRLGTLSRYPLMPQMERPTWGLSWQSFPVALWHEHGGWGFLQWRTGIEDQHRAHPAERRAQAYLRNALTFDKPEPIVGHTWSIQDGGQAIVLRTMPALYPPWDHLTDRFRLVKPKATLDVSEPSGPWTQMVLDFGDQQVSIHHISLDGRRPTMLQQEGGPWDWQITYDAAELADCTSVTNLWAFSLEGRIDNAPRLEKIEGRQAWHLMWDLGGTGPSWNLQIDPAAATPLLPLEGWLKD